MTAEETICVMRHLSKMETYFHDLLRELISVPHSRRDMESIRIAQELRSRNAMCFKIMEQDVGQIPEAVAFHLAHR